MVSLYKFTYLLNLAEAMLRWTEGENCFFRVQSKAILTFFY